MQKKILALVLALAMIFSFNAVNLSVLAQTTEPTITIESVQTKNYKNVVVKVLVNNNPGIWGMDLKISYDKTALTLTSVENGDFFQESEWTKGNLKGEVYILSYEAAGFDNITTENATLATLNFRIGDDATDGDNYAITASYNAGDIIASDFEEINFNIINGNIKVGCDHTDSIINIAGRRNATCTTNGYSGDKVCTDCAEILDKGKEIAALGHKYQSKTTKATLTKNGSIVKKCSVCGDVAIKATIFAPKTIKLAATTYTYTGKTITPAVTVKNSKGATLKNGTDYTVSYASGRKNVGKYSVKVTFKGNYSGTKTLSFTINPVKTTVSKLTAGVKSIKVAITKKSTQVTGYEVQYATSKTFKSAKTVNVKSYKTTTVNLTKLSAKKTYYVRVRTYKTVGKTKYYSGWSTYKYTKTK